MAQVTYRPGHDDPSTVRWLGVVFRANVPVDVDDDHILRKVGRNRFFEVGGGAPPELDPGEKDALAAEAEALGIDVDKRWGVAKLKAAIEAKKAEA